MNLVQYTPEQLLAMDNSRPIIPALTPLERYNLIKRRNIGTSKRFRKFHFIAITNCTKIHVFNGIDDLIIVVDNCFKGVIEARKHCLELFTTISESQKELNELERNKRNYKPHDYYQLKKELAIKAEVENKNGGFMFTLYDGNVLVDLAMGYDR